MKALISVSDKDGIVSFAKELVGLGVEILSTGGTAKLLREEGLSVTDVSDYTGFPEMMDGRVKTLHPKVHGGILGRRGTDDSVMAEHGIDAIDLVIVNLYPFAQATADPACTLDNAIENIDIGGPAMLRAAAKNHASVTVITSPVDYDRVVDALKGDGATDALRFDLAVKAFEHTAHYDGMIANYLGKRVGEETVEFPRTANLQVQKVMDLRYGENPHQNAAFYREHDAQEGTIAAATQLQGKELSYNNIADTDAALQCVKQFDEPTCVIVKHANPCGVAVSDTIMGAYEGAYATDPTSAFGGIIAFNRELDATTATAIIERQFVEVIIAPSVSQEAQKVCAAKKNVRVLTCGALDAPAQGLHYTRVEGGLLVQERDLALYDDADWKVVSDKAPNDEQVKDLIFAMQIAKFVKSNAIVYCKDLRTIGVGAGQMSRVYSAKVAGIKAADENLEVKGSVMASDAFFPFRDGIDAAAQAGISAIIQPGGSQNDEEVIAAANEHGIAMVFTGMRHFRH